MEYQVRAAVAHVKGCPLDTFVRAYLACAEWCGLTEDQDRASFDRAARPRWSRAAVKQACADCRDFRELAGSNLDGIDESQAGHDFWLTRNGHGAGFWDRGLGAVGDQLTKDARGYSEVYVFCHRGILTLSR